MSIMDDIQIFNSRFLVGIKQVSTDVPALHINERVVIGFNGEYTLSFYHELGQRILPNVPENYHLIVDSETNLTITLPEFLENQLLYILCEANRIVEEGMFDDFKTFFSGFLLDMFRLFGGSEPLSLEDQKGVFGELMVIKELFQRYREPIFTEWNRNGLVDIDMTQSHQTEIEVKTVSDISEPIVSISFFDQLRFQEDRTSILAVIQCNTTKTNFSLPTLPAFIDDVVEEMFGEIESDASKRFEACLQQQIMGYPWSEADKNRFTTRFSTNPIMRNFQVQNGDSADQMANQKNMPNGVELGGYQLDASVLAEI